MHADADGNVGPVAPGTASWSGYRHVRSHRAPEAFPSWIISASYPTPSRAACPGCAALQWCSGVDVVAC